MSKRLFVAIAVALVALLSSPVDAQAPSGQLVRPFSPIGVDGNQIYQETIAFTGADQEITFTKPSSIITIFVQPSSSTAYIHFTQDGLDATTSDFALPPGFGFTFQSLPQLASIHIIGSDAVGSFSIVAH